jgi:hypothetical protein
LTGGTGVVNLGSGQLYKDASGNVGIGTSSPSYKLDVIGQTSRLAFGTTGSAFGLTTNTGGNLYFGLDQSTGGGLSSGSSAYAGVLNHTGAYSLQFGTNNTIRATIDSSGNVGIGTSTPDSKLTISKNSASPAAITGNPYLNIVGANSESPKLNFDAYANLPTITFRRANGTQASPSALNSGDQLANFAVFGYGATSYTTTNRGFITINADQNWTDSAQGTRIAFATTTTGTASAATERMRIDSSGNVLIGITSARANAGDVQVSKGISFPATQSAQSDANTLDDYEEGTWTGTIKGLTTDPTTPVTATGSYTKIGRLVFARITYSNITTTGASGDFYVTGLPFTAGNNFATGNVMTYSLATFAGANNLSPYVTGTSVFLYHMSSNGIWAAATHNAGTARYLELSVTYEV